MPDPSQAHAGHDTLILAAAVDHDPDPATIATIERMTADCPACAAIVDDLRLLATGLAALPAELPAPRDFRITDVQAEHLRRGGFLRRLLQPFGIDGLPGLQPVAGALTAVGLAGILLTSVPLGFGAAGAAAPAAADRANSAAGGNGSYAAPSTAAEAQQPAPVPSDMAAEGPGGKAGSPVPQNLGTGAGAQPGTSPTTGGSTAFDRGNGVPPAAVGDTRSSSFGPASTVLATVASIPPLTLASIVLLVVGVALFSLRLLARRID
jgi:hypothetical protein